MGNSIKDTIIPTMCASHCGGACLLKVHVKDGVITRIETDEGEEPQLRACLRGRAYRQRVHSPDRLKYPMKRIGARGEGKFERISWDEALDKIATELKRVKDSYGPGSIALARMIGDPHSLHTMSPMYRLLNLAGGQVIMWGITSFHAGVYASLLSYGTFFASNTRDDLLNSKLIIMWGWDPATVINGTNTCWFLAQAKESGTRIVSVDPRYTDTAAIFADQWIPIRPGTDTAMLIAIAYVMIKENLQDQKFLDTYTIGFNQFRDYVLGIEDGVPKTPAWAEAITGVPATTVENLAREYATTKPAALMAGIAAGRSAGGEQYHRAAIVLAAMTGNVGIHGGDAAARAWESLMGGYPYRVRPMFAGVDEGLNPLDKKTPPGKHVPLGYRENAIHYTKLPDAILKGKAGGYPSDIKLLYVGGCNYVTQFPNINKLIRALQSLEFVAVQEQFMTPTAKYADILLPVCTYMERNDIAFGVGTAYIGAVNKVIEPLGESKSPLQIAVELAARMGIENFLDKTEEEFLKDLAQRSGVPDYAKLKKEGVYKFKFPEPYVAFKEQIKDPAKNPFRTRSGKIELYSQAWAEMNNPALAPVPQYVEHWESRNDPLAKKYPLQLINTHFKRRALSQFDNIPWLRELMPQAIWINSEDAQARGIRDGEMVRVFNDRGETIIQAKVTERIMTGVVDVPHGAWYDPDDKGVDRGGCVNVLTDDTYSPGGSFTYNTGLVQVSRA